MPKSINIARALSFNALTTSLAAVGFAYSEEKFGGQTDTVPRILFVLLLATFALSFVYGLFVAGKAADFPDETKDTADTGLKRLGQIHSFSLLGGLLAVAVWFVYLEFRPAVPDGRCETELALPDGARLILAHDCDAVRSEPA